MNFDPSFGPAYSLDMQPNRFGGVGDVWLRPNRRLYSGKWRLGVPIKVLEGNGQEPEFICLYGGPGTRKTNLAASVCRAVPSRFGAKALYLGLDPRAAALASVHPDDKANLIRIELAPDDKGKLDPYNSVRELLTTEYRSFPEAGTLIVDTATVLAQDILLAVANSGKFSDKHIQLESRGEGKLVIPMEGDYGAAQSMVMNLLRFAERCRLSQVWVFHEEWVEPKSNTPEIMYGGPATVGRAIVEDVEARFMHVFHSTVKGITGQDGKPTTQYKVFTNTHNIWKAKLRCGGKNPMPEVILGDDPTEFWRKWDEATRPQLVQSNGVVSYR